MSEVIVCGITVFAVTLVGFIFFTRMRLKTIALALISVGAVFAGGVFLFSHLLDGALQRSNGPRHVFELPGRPAFLAEEVAMDKARATLVQDGYTNENWQPASKSRTSAPDGRTDVYFLRNLTTPNCGSLVFTNAGNQECIVYIKLDGDHVVCQRITPK
jgi:hypothetical protein